MSQREVVETLDKILKEPLQVWLAREIPPSQGTLPFNQVICPHSNGGQKKAKYHNLEELPGASQVQILFRSQLVHQIY